MILWDFSLVVVGHAWPTLPTLMAFGCQVAEYKDGAWGGITGPSRAALAEENEVLRSHLANLGWSQEMMHTTNVRTAQSADASSSSSLHSSSAQVSSCCHSTGDACRPAVALCVLKSSRCSSRDHQSPLGFRTHTDPSQRALTPAITAEPMTIWLSECQELERISSPSWTLEFSCSGSLED